MSILTKLWSASPVVAVVIIAIMLVAVIVTVAVVVASFQIRSERAWRSVCERKLQSARFGTWFAQGSQIATVRVVGSLASVCTTARQITPSEAFVQAPLATVAGHARARA